MSNFSNIRIVPCSCCAGDRGWDVPYDIDYRDGGLIERWVACGCEDGSEEIELEPVTLEDLQREDANACEA